jgi:hypothetical protein
VGSSGNVSRGNTPILIVQQNRKCYWSVDKKDKLHYYYLKVTYVNTDALFGFIKPPETNNGSNFWGKERVGGDDSGGGEWEGGFSWEV